MCLRGVQLAVAYPHPSPLPKGEGAGQSILPQAPLSPLVPVPISQVSDLPQLFVGIHQPFPSPKGRGKGRWCNRGGRLEPPPQFSDALLEPASAQCQLASTITKAARNGQPHFPASFPAKRMVMRSGVAPAIAEAPSPSHCRGCQPALTRAKPAPENAAAEVPTRGGPGKPLALTRTTANPRPVMRKKRDPCVAKRAN